MDTIIDEAKKLDIKNLITIPETKILSKIETYIHKTCRKTPRNNSRKRLSSFTDQEVSKRQRTHSEYCNFHFETQCFYYGNICIQNIQIARILNRNKTYKNS